LIDREIDLADHSRGLIDHTHSTYRGVGDANDQTGVSDHLGEYRISCRSLDPDPESQQSSREFGSFQ